MYCYRLSDGECFYLNIPMGAVTTGKVDIIIPKGASLYGMEFDGENKMFRILWNLRSRRIYTVRYVNEI